MDTDLATKAFFLGILSAVSLPLGALLGCFWRPRDLINSALMSFGGGALLAALTLEIVAPALRHASLWAVIIGCVAGGLLFIALNALLDRMGGYLRKAATTLQHLMKVRLRETRDLVEQLGRVDILRELPPEEVQALVPHVNERDYPPGRTIFRKGEPGDALYLIRKGTVRVIEEPEGRAEPRILSEIGPGGCFGEIALLTDAPRTATVVTATETTVFLIQKSDFDEAVQHSPRLAAAVRALIRNRVRDLEARRLIEPAQGRAWARRALRHLRLRHLPRPTDRDIQAAAKEHGGAPLAIWLGILLDGIPESLVIGSSLAIAAGGGAAGAVSWMLIAGLFLSNFPEALSSAIGMRKMGYSLGRTMLLWGSLCLITGVGAWFGYYLFANFDISRNAMAVIEGLAAGSMLVMIAQTMIPEAYEKGGAVVGMATLLGFLAAIACSASGKKPQDHAPQHPTPGAPAPAVRPAHH